MRDRRRDYTSVPQDDRAERTQRPRKKRTAAGKASQILHSLMWLGAAAFVWYYSNLWEVITTDMRINRTFLNLGVVFLLSVVFLVLYMAFWIPYVDGVDTQDYNEYCPRVVMAAVLQMFLQWVSFNIALWPIYGWVSLVIVSVSGIAAIFSTNLLPAF